ncbi:MAG: hypothetical protein A2V93_03525 [Ignavibacteria bacterium RBG_16_34_14]|nr:MAG: hypothetical protein A2V93_03525 [Ignavibacteria bacterium RBG_16_34_14]
MKEVKPKVLIAEDDSIIAFDIKKYLINNGYKVIAIVSYGFKAVDIAKEKKPNVVLLDIMLKGYMNGIEAAEIISKKLKIPVIFLTALTDDETFLSAKDTKTYAFISKPFSTDQLEKAIKFVLKVGKY